MNVFGHDHVPGEVESIPLPRLLEGLLEDVAGPRCAEKGSALIAAKRHKVQTACFLKALEAPRHDSSVTQRLDCETRDAKLLHGCSAIGKVNIPALSQRTRQGRGTLGVRIVERVGQPPPGLTPMGCGSNEVPELDVAGRGRRSHAAVLSSANENRRTCEACRCERAGCSLLRTAPPDAYPTPNARGISHLQRTST